jgi:hypothetical protein
MRAAVAIGLSLWGLMVACGGAVHHEGNTDLATTADAMTDAMTDACGTAGGSCVAPSACAVGHGYLSSLGAIACGSFDAAVVTCCYPTCGGTPTEFACCGFQLTTRPLCSAGMLACPEGTSRCASSDM